MLPVISEQQQEQEHQQQPSPNGIVQDGPNDVISTNDEKKIISTIMQSIKKKKKNKKYKKNLKEDRAIQRIVGSVDSWEQQQQQQPTTTRTNDWCTNVRQARRALHPDLHIQVPCEIMTPHVQSAIVCMLTNGNSTTIYQKQNRTLFSANDYINGVLALGASANENINANQTHLLLLLQKGYQLSNHDTKRLQAVGWIIGTAPEIKPPSEYVPNFPRYKTTYTKISAIGLSEYNCVLLLDADTLVVGNLHDLMTCTIFTETYHRLAATLDYYKNHWEYFNTGSILWKPNTDEMNRVYQLLHDHTFMKRFRSDQEFLNHVYPERFNFTKNNLISQGKYNSSVSSSLSSDKQEKVIDLTWYYNAQTHVEVENITYWHQHRKYVKILHFTEKKGWQCQKRYKKFSQPTTTTMMEKHQKLCNKKIPTCFCDEAYLYWIALKKADNKHIYIEKNII